MPMHHQIFTVEHRTPTTTNDDLYEFLRANRDHMSAALGGKFNLNNTAVEHMLNKGIVLVGKRRGEIRGVHVSWLARNPIDMEILQLHQQLFYVIPESGRMAYYLFQKFIDIGKSNANHIITMLTRHTNIKPETLKKFGFNELEVLYSLEVR